MHVSELPQYAAALFYWNAIGWSGTVTKVNIKPIFGKNENIVQLLKEQIDERREKLDRLAKLRKSLKENILKNCCQCNFILAVILLLTLVSF